MIILHCSRDTNMSWNIRNISSQKVVCKYSCLVIYLSICIQLENMGSLKTSWGSLTILQYNVLRTKQVSWRIRNVSVFDLKTVWKVISVNKYTSGYICDPIRKFRFLDDIPWLCYNVVRRNQNVFILNIVWGSLKIFLYVVDIKTTMSTFWKWNFLWCELSSVKSDSVKNKLRFFIDTRECALHLVYII